jgi:hypothetical protein
VDVHRLVIPLAGMIGQPGSDRPGANGDPGIVEEGQQGWLTDVDGMAQGERADMGGQSRRGSLPAVAR